MDRFTDLPTPIRAAVFGVVAAALLALAYVAMASSGHQPQQHARRVSTFVDTGTVVHQPTTPAPAPATASAGSPGQIDGTRVDLSSPVPPAVLRAEARTAIGFARSYTSFRYNDNFAAHVARLKQMTAAANTVDFSALTPTGSALADVRGHRVTTTSTIRQAAVSLVSADTITYRLSITTTTTATNTGKQTSTADYMLTMGDTDGAWAVVSFDLDSGSTASSGD